MKMDEIECLTTVKPLTEETGESAPFVELDAISRFESEGGSGVPARALIQAATKQGDLESKR